MANTSNAGRKDLYTKEREAIWRNYTAEAERIYNERGAEEHTWSELLFEFARDLLNSNDSYDLVVSEFMARVSHKAIAISKDNRLSVAIDNHGRAAQMDPFLTVFVSSLVPGEPSQIFPIQDFYREFETAGQLNDRYYILAAPLRPR